MSSVHKFIFQANGLVYWRKNQFSNCRIKMMLKLFVERLYPHLFLLGFVYIIVTNLREHSIRRRDPIFSCSKMDTINPGWWIENKISMISMDESYKTLRVINMTNKWRWLVQFRFRHAFQLRTRGYLQKTAFREHTRSSQVLISGRVQIIFYLGSKNENNSLKLIAYNLTFGKNSAYGTNMYKFKDEEFHVSWNSLYANLNSWFCVQNQPRWRSKVQNHQCDCYEKRGHLRVSLL